MSHRIETRVDRRNLLKTAGAAAAMSLSGPVLRAAEKKAGDKPTGDLRTKAKNNLPLGIFTGVYAGLPVDEAARRIREDGFRCVVLQYSFKDVQFDPWKPDWDVLKKMTTALEKNDVRVVGLYGYHNIVGPDEAARKRNDQFISLLINNWKRFGSPIISTETGTFNAKSQFADDPKNFTEEGYQAARDALARLAGMAEKTKAVIAIEAYWRNLIGTIDRAERLFHDVDSPALKLTMDPCNYYKPEDLPRMKPMLREMFKRVGGRTVLAHAKDVRQTEKGQDHPAAGRGVLAYPLFLRLLARLDREIPLVLEHLTLDDVSRARDYVKAQFEKV